MSSKIPRSEGSERYAEGTSEFFNNPDAFFRAPPDASHLEVYRVRTTYTSNTGMLCLPRATSSATGGDNQQGGGAQGEGQNEEAPQGDGQRGEGNGGKSESPSEGSHVSFVSIHQPIIYRTIEIDAVAANQWPQVPSPALALQMGSGDGDTVHEAVMVDTSVQFLGPQKTGTGSSNRIKVVYRYATNIRASEGLSMPETYTWIRDPQLQHVGDDTANSSGSPVHTDYGLTRVDPHHPAFGETEAISWYESIPTDPIA